MRSVLNKFIGAIIAVGITVFIFSSCSDDIILEPLDSLLGEYDGQYTLTDLSQGAGGVVKVDVDIAWIFRDFTYELDDVSATVCSPKGEYKLNGDQINLDQKFAGSGVCNPSFNPVGDFSLRRPTDSLILTQLVNNTFIEIKLKKRN